MACKRGTGSCMSLYMYAAPLMCLHAQAIVATWPLRAGKHKIEFCAPSGSDASLQKLRAALNWRQMARCQSILLTVYYVGT